MPALPATASRRFIELRLLCFVLLRATRIAAYPRETGRILSMSNYAKRLNAHLVDYKNKHLGRLDPGTFRDSDRRYEHILPKDQAWLNILEPYRHDIQQYLAARSEITLHQYFHHLNSSQAFAFNLFFPYFEKGGATQLLSAMDCPVDLLSWEPECVVDKEEGTNVDVTWQTSSTRTFCEVKLSEQEFGTAKNDERHRAKLERIYRPGLADACSPEWLQPESFFQNYQLFRNVWLIAREPASRLVFLLPRANTRIWQQLGAFLSLLSEPLVTRIQVIAVEDVVDSLTAASDLPPALRSYTALLREKYVFPALA